MDEPIRSERSLADEALLRGSDDLLVDFERGFRVFRSSSAVAARCTTSGRRLRCSARRASPKSTATTGKHASWAASWPAGATP
jgi:hypothetical protein